MRVFNNTLGRFASYGPTILRLILGTLLAYHGIDKFQGGISNVEGFFDTNGVPLPGFTAPLVAATEIIAGIALILGIYTRVAATILTAVLIGALAFVKLSGDVLGGSELDFVYIGGLIAVALLGPGRIALDDSMNIDDTVIELRTPAEARVGANA